MMKNTCITRPIDQLNRVVIPQDIVKKLGIQPRDYFEFSYDNNEKKISLKLKKTTCTLCEKNKVLLDTNINNTKICNDCLDTIKSINS